MDLKIKDVAELLNVSEKTIRRWLVGGKIPAYRLNSQYRFSRIEIENWVMKCKLSNDESDFLSLANEQQSCADQWAVSQESIDLKFASPSSESTDSLGKGSFDCSHQTSTSCVAKSKQDLEHERLIDVEKIKPKVQVKMGMQQFSLYRAVHKGAVFNDIEGTTKEEIISNTMQRAAGILGRDPEVLIELLLDRERLMSTALNHGIAVPHSREFVFEGPFDVAILVFPKAPIDYGALDNEPVHTLFFLFASGDKQHLHLLAKIAHLSGNEKAQTFFRTRPGKKEVLEYICEWEGKP